MSAILKFDFQKRKQSHFSEENYLNYTKIEKDTILHVTITFFAKTRANKNKQWTHLGFLKKAIWWLLQVKETRCSFNPSGTRLEPVK